MNRHERCEAALQGRPVDRMPRYCPAVSCEVVSSVLGRQAHGGTGSLHYAEACAMLKGKAAHREFVVSLFEDLAEFNRVFDIDVFRMPWRLGEKPALQVDENTFLFGDPEGDHRIFRYDATTGEFGCVRTVEKTPLPPEEKLRRKVEQKERALESGELEQQSMPSDYLYILDKYGEEFFVIGSGGYIGVGMDADELILLLTKTDLVKRRVRLQAYQDAALGRCLSQVAGPHVLLGGGDLAGNNGPFYSPELFRDVVLPPMKAMLEQLNGIDVHYIFRSDGVLWPLMDMIFGEAGCPGYGEVDRHVGMTVGAIRQNFPDLVLWGNMSCQNLQKKSPGWIREEAQRCVEESGGTAYFHGPSNAILRNTPIKAVEAMFSV